MYVLYVFVKCMLLIQIWIQIDIKSFLEVLEATFFGTIQAEWSLRISIQIEWSLKNKSGPSNISKHFTRAFGYQLAEISWMPTSRNKRN